MGKVRFCRLSKAAYEAIEEKVADMLYVVNETGDFDPSSLSYVGVGELYLGDTMIGVGYVGACYGESTTSSGSAFTASVNGYELVNGGVVSILFSGRDVPANATLNIGGTGAKAIWFNGEAIKQNIIKKDKIGVFVYDGTRYNLVGFGLDLMGGQGTNSIQMNKCIAFGTDSFAEGAGAETEQSFTITGGASDTTYTTSASHNIKLGDILKYGSNIRYVTDVPDSTHFTVNSTFSSSAISGGRVYKVTGVALSPQCHVEGLNNSASGTASHAEGRDNVSSGSYSHVEGHQNRSTGTYSHVEGYQNENYSNYSHVEGYQNKAVSSGGYKHVEGYKNVGYGTVSHAEGRNTVAYGNYSHSEGFGSPSTLTLTKDSSANATTYSIASTSGMSIGSIVEYNGAYRRVMNLTSTTFTLNSTLNPSDTLPTGTELNLLSNVAFGSYSHIEGTAMSAIGDSSHAEGNNTVTRNKYEHAQGSFNKSNAVNSSFGNAGNTIHSIGIGTSHGDRKNAVEVMQNGDVYVHGIGNYNGTGTVRTLQSVLNGVAAAAVDFVGSDDSHAGTHGLVPAPTMSGSPKILTSERNNEWQSPYNSAGLDLCTKTYVDTLAGDIEALLAAI